MNLTLESRRYIGSKAKLVDWIADTLQQACPHATSLCDLFAGTGIVSARAAQLYPRVVVNDLLHANRVIYEAFLGPGRWDAPKLQALLDAYNALDPELLPDGYFTRHYGGRYFEPAVARLIDHVRADIDDPRHALNAKERAILLATLIYNIDRHANTVGHFDAYIKRPIQHRPLLLRPIEARAYDGVEIHQEDANRLAPTLEADITYIDPPYNSRQYSRFYHVYETLVKGDEPPLYGVALKPRAENLSRYCTTSAPEAFAQLISSLHTRYIAVSYNNNGASLNPRSNAKISDTDIIAALATRGHVDIFTTAHRPFSAGRGAHTENQERLFLCSVTR